MVSNLKSNQAPYFYIQADLDNLDTLTIKDALNGSNEPYGINAPKNVIHPNATLGEVFKMAVDQLEHRFWILDDDMCPIKIITLTDIIREVVLFKYYSETE